MNMKKLIGLAVVSLTCFGVAGEASAQLIFCNRTGDSVQVAISYRGGDTWISRGWYTVHPGNCTTALGNALTNQYYYFYAQQMNGSLRWQGNYNNCVTRQRFTIYNSTTNCGGRGYLTYGFRQITVGTARHTVNLNP